MAFFSFLQEQIPTFVPPKQEEPRHLASDSRKVQKGSIFAVLPGTQQTGFRYLPQALTAGASWVILTPEDYAQFTGKTPLSPLVVVSSSETQFILVEKPRQFWAQLVAAFYAKQPEICAAVTGTNGKSSVVDFVRQIWTLLGKKAASIGTLGIRFGSSTQEIEGGLTTPDPLSLHKELAWLAEESVTHSALEASSHGLDQYRLDGVKLTAAAFTQLSQDHLDYHQTMSTYFMAKQRLFADLLLSSGISVLNADIPEYPVLRQIAEQRKQQVFDYGKRARSLVWKAWEPTPHGQHLHVLLLGRSVSWFVPLIGDFQGANLLCSIGLVLASGTALEELLQIFPPSTALPLQGVPGRLERLEGAGKQVLVDYAHSPHALEKALAAIRPHTKGRILLVFGCGGNRDATKRPLMGKIAEQKSDFLFLTDDNPREEDPDCIRKEICAGLTARIPFQEIPDRREAIAAALAEATAEDCVVIAGKGHEVTQQRGKERYPFNDQDVVREILHL